MDNPYHIGGKTMKHVLLALLALSLIACNVGSPDRAVALVTSTPAASAAPVYTQAPVIQTVIVSATNPPPTLTQVPTLTPTWLFPTPTRMVTNTPTLTITPPPTVAPTPARSFNGIRMDYFMLNKSDRKYVPGEDIWFKFKVTNIAGRDIPYSCIGALMNDVKSQCSWGDSVLRAGQSLEWEDHINHNAVGRYVIFGGVCYGSNRSTCDTVRDRNGWADLSEWISIEINQR